MPDFLRKTYFCFLFPLLLLIFLPGKSAAQKYLEEGVANLIKSNAQYDYNSFFLEKLKDHRVLMLADNGHGETVYMKTVTDFLNYWVDTLEKDIKQGNNSKYPAKLYLILESDSEMVADIYRFIESGNPYDAVSPTEFMGFQFTTGMIEFYYQLGQIHKRIEGINKAIPENKRVSFRIFGPEKVLDLSNWNTEKRDQYFLKERDEYSSKKVIDLLEKEPDARAVIFYGSGHFSIMKEKKLENSNEQGYYIAHYLNEHFKDEGGIYRVDQMSFDKLTWLSKAYRMLDKNYVIDNSVFEGVAVPNNFFVSSQDASFLIFDRNIRMKHISQIPSETLIDCILNKAGMFYNMNSDLHRGNLFTCLYYLSEVSGREMEVFMLKDSAAVMGELDKWKKWRSDWKANMADVIYNQELIKKRIDFLASSKPPVSQRYIYDLSQMTMASIWNKNELAPERKAEYYKKCLNQYSRPMIIEDLINLLWVATKAEKNKAVEYLKKETSQNFENEEDWTTWWRNSEYCK
ncbi:MAG: hypothetical protein HF314_04345 [Ignavibacteria bacterium]|jgi:hypothetical protein|nr:hypothetical protein [Ignavibacteria bacterium]MCU7502280.1 hypothetical protein [Ignavibacteria bacterium]MCU7516676.1 hypothetical protein [Ignavibacteria bacterium]